LSSRNFVYGLYPETFHLPAGVTLAIPALAGQNAAILKYISGGSLSIVGTTASTGSSYAVDNRYPMGTGETVNLDLSGPQYVVAVGSTCVFSLLRGRSAGF
jgi:hypothetical protein